MTSSPEFKLSPCPASPNCVCSEEDGSHHIAPFVPAGDPAATWSKILDYLQETDRVRIVAQRDNYIRAEFRTAIFRFVDDVEFLWKRDENEIAVRSASRIGYSDLGTNRRRIEQIRADLIDARVL